MNDYPEGGKWTREELVELIEEVIADKLKENLSLSIHAENDYGGGNFKITVKYDGEAVASDTLSLYSLASRLETSMREEY